MGNHKFREQSVKTIGRPARGDMKNKQSALRYAGIQKKV